MRFDLSRHGLLPLAAATVLVLCGCMSGSTNDRSAATPTGFNSVTTVPAGAGAPRLGVGDSGRTIELRVGGTATITLVNPSLRWGSPKVDGTAVTISEIISESATPGRSWSVTAREAGTATVTVVGSPTCGSATPPCAAPDFQWSVRFEVR